MAIEVISGDIAQTIMELLEGATEAEGGLPIIEWANQAETGEAIQQTNCSVIHSGRFARFDIRTASGQTFRINVEEMD
jgi:hypothetical protein